jgi:hypothetical protein
MGKIKLFLFIFLFLGFFMLLNILTTVEHEYLHQLIFKNYGIDSTVKYYFWEAIKEQSNPMNWLDFDMMNMQASGITYPDQNSTGVCNETCEMLHTQVEIMDHGVSSITGMLFILFFLYIVYDMFFKTNVKEEYKQAILEESKEQEMKMLKDEYYKLTGRKWETYIEYLDKKHLSDN